ncbi:hypothetical protein JOD97_000454 [Duganella sp. 1411]|uniref:hypothetical protein n=1 Tax=Duganella sp. 1411 TaxID=2806572 RepID=UPI001AE486B6|nr:hypothetical protein [Duganella sp. 1411]MBP1202440.1 hypothetical protein [Duganella sp. 1411]
MTNKIACSIAKGTARIPLRRFVAASALALAGLAATSAGAASYSWNNVKIVAGGYVDGIVAHPAQQGLFYARTDIGGAYRYNSGTSTWVPLNDWTTSANWHQMGIETIAVDPRNTNMLYMVAGMYTQNWNGNAAVLVSSNQGASFNSYPLSFRTGGNVDGRNTGEKLQVDPNLGSVLVYGTFNDSAQGATNGLWKSVNSGQTWTRLSGFTALSNDGSGAGVAFVTFHQPSANAGSATPTIFAGVSTASAASSGTTLYKSTDGGAHWSAVAGGPSGQYPNHGQIGKDGNLYITYGNAIGPNGMTSGQVWKYSVGQNTWQNITPPNPNNYSFGYGGLAVDTKQSGALVVMTMDRWWPTDTMFRSTNGGSTWTDVGATATRDASLSPWVKFGAAAAGFGNWGQVAIDPFNSAHAFYATGQTIWATNNLTAADAGQATNWAIGANGVEETATLALLSPSSGAPLISGLGDICGFTHTSLTASPPAGMVSNPICGNGTGLDYAKALPSKIVRVGTGSSVYGAVSTNGGTSWTPFANQAGSTKGEGTVAISADGGTIVWGPKDVAPAYSTNNGASWTSTGLPVSQSWQIVSDGLNGNLFYAFDAATGIFYASANKGVNWYTASSGLAQWGKATAVTGNQGDVWMAGSSGLYRSTSSGSGWSQISSGVVTAATSVGFGKAASGASYPTIYLAGTVSGVTGLFRSTNSGGSWVRINDDAHQWGGFSLVVGDPKTFGTVYVAPNSGRGIIYGTSSN